jgi:hypothetical protein
MKYFTPERYLRLGNLDNRKAFLAAQEDWENALRKYRARLRQIRTRLPAGLRRLLESVYLHDARVLGMWLVDRQRFTISLQPESDPSRLVLFAYSLVKLPQVHRAALPASACSTPVTWLYDEVDIAPPTGGQGVDARPGRTFRHNILLSNGWEIRLRFHRVAVTRAAALIPAAPGGCDLEALVPRSA